MSKQQPTIDRLHHDIGFWLQHRGESADGTAVSLPIDQFERLVDTYLREIGREGDEKNEMVHLITGAARHRLVFLTSRTTGELSFDVRSLQEYMAAECIMTGEPEVVKARLKAIAPSPYWRNVFLFAASKCFLDAQSRHLQDSIRLLCEDLNSPADALLDATKSGSELALDVLQSGAVAENPNHARHMARIGLALLCEPYIIGESGEGIPAHRRLAVVYSESLKSVYREVLQLRIGQAELDRTIGAWPLLLQLIAAGLDWAVELGNRAWPNDHDAQKALLRRIPQESVCVPWMWTKLGEMISRMPPSEVRTLIGVVRVASNEAKDESDPIVALCRLVDGRNWRLKIPLRTSPEDKGGFQASVAPAFSLDGAFGKSFELLTIKTGWHAGWLPFLFASEFVKSPDAHTLVKVLNKCVDMRWPPSEKVFLHALPWPLANCLNAVESLEELRRIALRVESGALGDRCDWQAAEARWKSEGIALDVFVCRPTKEVRGDVPVNLLELPARVGWSVSSNNYPDSVLQRLVATVHRGRTPVDRAMVLWFLVHAGSYSGGIASCIKPSEFKT